MKKMTAIVLSGWMMWCDGSNGNESVAPEFFTSKQSLVDAMKENWRQEVLTWEWKKNAKAGCDFYEVTKIDYTIDVKTETRTETYTENKTIELGREVVFK